MGVLSIENLEKLSENGNAEASYELGLRYYRGIGTEIDYAKAKSLFEKAVARRM